MTRRLFGLGLILLAAASLAGMLSFKMLDQTSGAFACPSPGRMMAKVELIFGAHRNNGQPVSDDEWADFLAAEVTPRFPDGLTVLTGFGQWRGTTGLLVQETSRLLLIWHAPDASTDSRIEAIRAAYKARFGQESVLRADDAPACVSF